MTDTEAKALALVNAVRGCEKWESVKEHDLVPAEALFAALDRHAAELRELKERFSVVAARMVARAEEECSSLWAGVTREILAPFILPAPDPVSEWLAECSDGRVSDPTMTMLRLFYNWLSEKETRKIGEAGE